jgi:hypothetical protein
MRWGCGEQLTGYQMRAHFTICPKRPGRSNGSMCRKASPKSKWIHAGQPLMDRQIRLREVESFETQPMPLTPGARIGPFEILAQLGAGGMGEVL